MGVYACPGCAAPVLRGFVHFGGVHLYNEEGGVLYATPDLFQECVIARSVSAFTVDLPPASMPLYCTGKEAVLRRVGS